MFTRREALFGVAGAAVIATLPVGLAIAQAADVAALRARRSRWSPRPSSMRMSRSPQAARRSSSSSSS